MAPDLLYVIGPPGAGKSTLLAGLTAGLPRTQCWQPLPYVSYPGAVQLGRAAPPRAGTDGLHYCVQPHVVRWLATCQAPLVLGEGDRLANDRFFMAVGALGYRLTVVWLDAPWAVIAARVAQRPTPQCPSWVRGRVTKVRRLADRWVLPHWQLDATAPVERLQARVARHPAVAHWQAQSGKAGDSR